MPKINQLRINHRYCCFENIGVAPVIIPKLKLCDIERQIFGADLVECADYAALADNRRANERRGRNYLSPRAGRGRAKRG